MVGRTAVSTSAGKKLFLEDIGDYFTVLDVVYANQFEEETIDQETAEQTEELFLRGAPPVWLNFHISDLAESNGTGSPFIKRDGYKRLMQQIHKRRNHPGTHTVKLLHEQGCGGTTLAMQVLWDMRKTFRCAVLMGSPLESSKVAQEVIHLYTGGHKYDLNTVLLLINDEFILEHLQDRIMAEIEDREINVDVPVVILFNCVRSDHAVFKTEHYREKEGLKDIDTDYVILKRTLSDTEQKELDTKKEELSRIYGSKASQFHGFNILQTNFSLDYIQKACAIFNSVERKKKPLKTQLALFLSLLNAYVPGSYLLESECLDFLRNDDLLLELSMVTLMQPFSHLILSFQHDKSCERKIRMAHPMIAKHCTELMAAAGVARSETARNFLFRFCTEDISPYLLGFIKDLLTKREHKKDGRVEDSDLEKFSALILHISEMEDKNQSTSVLKVASNKFSDNSLFPQALARFNYGELEDFKEAEIWAKKAIERDPKKSFIADTLGQVHKNHLRNMGHSVKPRAILQLAQKAIEAFEREEELAEEEHRKSVTSEKSKVLWGLNTRGQFGFLQVCNILFYRLVSQNEIWKGVLTKNVSIGSVLESLGDNKLFRFRDLIENLREKVEKKFEFFDTFLTYSHSVVKKDKAYVSKQAAECYIKYLGRSIPEHNNRLQQTFQKLKQKMCVTSAGILSCLDRTCTSDIEHTIEWWEEIWRSKDSNTHAFVNLILAKIMLSNKNKATSTSDYKNALRKLSSSATQSEYHLLLLLLFWPGVDEDKPVSDLSQLIKHANCVYEREYKKMFVSRYLRPLFFLGPGKSLNRFVHRRVLEILWTKDALQESNTNWKNENIFRDSAVEDRLLRVEGVVRKYCIYATFRGTEVEVEANRRDSLCRSGQVSFYLGFTVKGPVAFSIRRKLLVKEGEHKIQNPDTAQASSDGKTETGEDPGADMA